MSEEKLTITIPCPFCGESLEFEVEQTANAPDFDYFMYEGKKEGDHFQKKQCSCERTVVFRECIIILHSPYPIK